MWGCRWLAAGLVGFVSFTANAEISFHNTSVINVDMESMTVWSLDTISPKIKLHSREFTMFQGKTSWPGPMVDSLKWRSNGETNSLSSWSSVTVSRN